VVDFPMNFILNTIPVKASFTQKPPKSDTLKYGAYLVNGAACIECHTQIDKGQIIPEFAYGGGRFFKMPNGEVHSANISPDEETGIGRGTANQFVTRFKAYTNPANVVEMGPKDVNKIMPWVMFAGMDTSDLRSIYAYLKTVKPIKNQVTHFVEMNNSK
jgi:hypothetical protein